MDKPLGIIELLTRIGEDNVRLQNLMESATNFTRRKRGFTAVTFLTREIDPNEVFHSNPRQVGLVIWLPSERVDAVRAAHARGEQW